MTDRRVYLAWALGLGLALAGPILPLLTLPSKVGGIVLVVSPPWADPLAVIRNASGRPIGPERTVLGYFATSETPGFTDRLRAAGAWAILDGDAVASLCGWDIT